MTSLTSDEREEIEILIRGTDINDIEFIHDLVVRRSRYLDRKATQELQIGDNVWFDTDSGRQDGVVTKRKIKSVIVETNNGSTWNVRSTRINKLEEGNVK